MRNRKSLSKPNKALLMTAVLHWVLTFFTDHIIFSYVMWDFSDGTQIIKTAMTYGANAFGNLPGTLPLFYQGGQAVFKVYPDLFCP